MAKSKSKKPADKVDDAIAATAKSDRDASQLRWKKFVERSFPEDTYPITRATYLKQCTL